MQRILWNGMRPNVAATSAVSASKVKFSMQTTGVRGHTAPSTHMTNAQNVTQESTVTQVENNVESAGKQKTTKHT